MPKVRYTTDAIADLKNIIKYTVDTWGKAKSIKYIERLELQTQSLLETPNIGKNRDDLAEGALSFPFEKHEIYYTRIPNGIAVMREKFGVRVKTLL